MTESSNRTADAFALMRCLVGPFALLVAVMLAFLVLLCIGPRAVPALLLPFLLAFGFSVFLLARHAPRPASADDCVPVLTRQLHALAIEGGEIAFDKLAHDLALTPAELEAALEEISGLAHVTFFWNRESGKILVPAMASVQLHCPHCAADLPLDAKNGRCVNCRCLFARNQPSKPYYHI